ncbi:single-stranded DNA-binding protein [Candidatus Saccharibacteria bacterium]|nr:single-stranded DNA-binding protein [Candidatus Saccharibacteria bacterium]
MRGFSKAILAGNLTRDPEVKSLTSGTQVTGFSIAVNRVFKDSSGNKQEKVSFFDCSAWGRLGETIAQYAKKGDAILLSGRLDQRSWEDKETGQKRSRVELVVEDFNFIGGNRNAGGSAGGSYGGDNTATSEGASEVVPEDIPDNIDMDEIPF